MATTVNVLCYRSKTLGNAEHPLMIRVCMDGKRKYKSLGVSVRAEHYPFKKYKVSKLNQETAKRALSKEDINRVLQYQTDNRFMRFPIDLFAFTYYMGGINFVDIANLTQKNIIDDRLIYKRYKTGKLIKLQLVPQAGKSTACYPLAPNSVDPRSQDKNTPCQL